MMEEEEAHRNKNLERTRNDSGMRRMKTGLCFRKVTVVVKEMGWASSSGIQITVVSGLMSRPKRNAPEKTD